MADPKLKVIVGADTSPFEKGMRTTKQTLKDFKDVSNDTLGKIGDAFGVPIGKVEKLTNSIKGLGSKLSASGNEGAAAFGKMLQSMGGLSSAVAGLGLAAAVASFKLLNAEAENFKKTVAGANMEMATAAYISTYKQVLHDINSATGQSVAEAESNLKKGWASFWADVKGFAVRAMTGTEPVMNLLIRSVGKKAATGQATTAETISNDIYAIQRQQSDNLVKVAELDAQIAEQRAIAYDNTYGAAQQLEAIKKMQDLIQQKLDLQLPLEQQLADLYKQRNDLASSTPQEIDQANQQAAKALKLERDANNEKTALLKRQNTLTAQVQKEAAAAKEIADSRAALAATLETLTTLEAPTAIATTTAGPSGIVIPVRAELDEESVEITAQQLTNLLSDAVSSVSVAVGELVGDLLTGGEAWDNFANTAMSSFADMAISVGKIAIESGTAVLGIQQALKLGNPYVAIAAGAALVALGAGVKAGLSNVASGAYASGDVATSSYSSDSSRSGFYEQSEITVNVVGTLKGEGSQLIAVINNENNRRAHTV